MTKWANRIIGEALVDPADLTPHPLNYRTHPATQSDALREVLDSVGWVQRVIVNQNTGHILDGHLRVEESAKRGEQVPVLYVDLTDDEERLVLATMDPLAALAGQDEATLESLISLLDDSVAALAMDVHGIGTTPEIAEPGVLSDVEPELRSMSFALTTEQHEQVTAAISRALAVIPEVDGNRNATAIAHISASY